MGLLAVNWVKVEEAIDVYDKYYLGWREKVERGEAATKLTGGYRAAVLLVVEEAKSRKGMDAADFPFEWPTNGEHPGFFELETNQLNTRLQESYHGIYRERRYVNAIGFYAALGGVCGELLREKGVESLPEESAGADQAEKDEVKRRGEVMTEEVEILYALKEVLGHVAVFCATARQDFHETVVRKGLSFATTIMDELVVQGQKGGNSGYGASSRKLQKAVLLERAKLRAKSEAFTAEGKEYVPNMGAASGGAQKEGLPASRE
jgi:hypothetical protein